MSPPRCSISFHLKRQLRQNQILKQKQNLLNQLMNICNKKIPQASLRNFKDSPQEQEVAKLVEQNLHICNKPLLLIFSLAPLSSKNSHQNLKRHKTQINNLSSRKSIIKSAKKIPLERWWTFYRKNKRYVSYTLL